jgi:hypothetical protein
MKIQNTMTNRRQTMQWLKENRQYDDQKKTDNTMALLTIVLSVFF